MKSEVQIRNRAMFMTQTQVPLVIISIITAIVTMLWQNYIATTILSVLIGMWLVFGFVIPNELRWCVE